MAWYLQQRRSHGQSDLAWLARLVDSFEQVSRAELSGCDPSLRAATYAHLSRPIASRHSHPTSN